MGSRRILSSTRVHIERKEKCDFHGFEDFDFDEREFEIDERENHHERRHEEKFEGCDCGGIGRERGFDGKRDRVIIEVMVDCKLDEQTHYTLILAQPCPSDGFNLPVDIRVRYCDSKKIETIRMIRGVEPWCAVGDLEYGQDLPKCRNRIPLYFTNGREFVDLRRRCCDL